MKNRLTRALVALPAMALVAGTGTVLATAAPAAAVTATCGMQVTTSITLTNDLGPCPGDGLDVVASGVVVNLNGHTITGSNTTNRSADNQQSGVHLLNVRGVIVQGPGTITHFDAGVAIDGGSGNVVKGLSVHDNIAHVLVAGPADPSNPVGTACDLGDGITTDNSSGNAITGNTVSHNGPFSGIALVDNSDRNTVSNNQVTDQTVSNLLPNGLLNPPSGTRPPDGNGPCGPFGADGPGEGRLHQDIGIRMEGPGANANNIVRNTVTDNQLEGIAVFDNICPNNPIGIPAGAPNDGNVIQSNTVLRNGGTDRSDGIAILSQGPGGIVCIPSNETIVNNISNNNTGNGIFLGGRGSSNNTVVGNTTNANAFDGIHVSGPSNSRVGPLPGSINNTLQGNTAMGNGSAATATSPRYDLFDGNPGCDNNRWSGNHFGTRNMTCIN